MAKTPDAKRRLAMFETMLLIRRFEEMNIRLYPQHSYMGQQHLYIGHEATAAGISAAMKPGDFLFTTHRNHGYSLARGIDPKRALAEVLGREGGTNRGRGGPWHIADKTKGLLQTSAMLGGGAGLGVGAGFALQRQKKKGVSVVHMGDGTLPEGIVYESFNMAAVFKLPVLFVCENNFVPGGRGGKVSAKSWDAVPRALSVRCEPPVDGRDPDPVFALASKAIERIRKGGGPVFIQPDMAAWPGSHMSPPEFATGVTDLRQAWGEVPIAGPHAAWIKKQDPVILYARKLVKSKRASPKDLLAIDGRVAKRLDEAKAYAEASPFPKVETVLDNVFA